MRIIVRFRRRGAAFVHPLDPAARTAILARGFEESDTVRVFPRGWTDAAARFRPTSIAGAVEALLAMARYEVELQHAVIAFTDLHARLRDPDREFLWQMFGVPVFEQCLGPGNQLVAAECEAHQGMHVCGLVPSEWDGEVEREKCGCGSTAPRLVERKLVMAAAMG